MEEVSGRGGPDHEGRPRVEGWGERLQLRPVDASGDRGAPPRRLVRDRKLAASPLCPSSRPWPPEQLLSSNLPCFLRVEELWK